MPLKPITAFLLISLFLISSVAIGSHLRAGEITAIRTDCGSLMYSVTVTVYLDTESGVTFGGDWLDFGDGNKTEIPEMTTIPRPDLGPNMGMATFTVSHLYSASQTSYVISYSEEFRNAGIVNISQSGSTPFYIETAIFLDPFLKCNENLPILDSPPIDRGCVGVSFFHNPAAHDIDGDSLSFELLIPKRSSHNLVFNYIAPNAPGFYADYSTGNETHDGPPGFSIDPLDGNLVWDAPGKMGEYNIAFRIIEWRKDEFHRWRMVSYVVRDMQIIIEDCMNSRPDLILPADTCVVAGDVIEKTIFGIDPENDPVKIEIFSQVLHLPSAATFTPDPPVFQPSADKAELKFRWNTSCEHIRNQYYKVVFKITDKPDNGPPLVTFRTWQIKVIGPAPKWKDAKLLIAKRIALLQWKNYECPQAERMQIWRKTGGSNYEAGNCITGMPDLGYTLVDEIKLKDSVTNNWVTQYMDDNHKQGLAYGSGYCYRLVAVFPDPKGGESYVSNDTCLAPVLVDAPVITKVSVEETGDRNGSIRVGWYGPFQIDKTVFPGPYTYMIYRGTGFTGQTSLALTANPISDTTFLDTGIDTESAVFTYSIVLYSNTIADPDHWQAIDTSSAASSVRLDAVPKNNEISTVWKAEVPWSNKSEQFPYHLIYRGHEGDPFDKFVLIDSVDVQRSPFAYSDNGTYQNIPIKNGETWCYRVMTRGTYNNEAITAPLQNFSEIACATAGDIEKPCVPELSIVSSDCEKVFETSLGDVKEFSNKIYWNIRCAKKVRYYRVYSSSNNAGGFTLIADHVTDTFFVARNLSSFAACYKVSAVDSKGLESELSVGVCNDNCPQYALPNVFSPNGDECNDVFSAYGLKHFNPGSPESCVPGSDNITKCMRFAEGVSFTVYNRWGKEIYTYESGIGDKSLYINWDGRDNTGQLISPGVYYYQAKVKFTVMDPAKKQQTLKGWIKIMY
jgi:hypothetical protein